MQQCQRLLPAPQTKPGVESLRTIPRRCCAIAHHDHQASTLGVKQLLGAARLGPVRALAENGVSLRVCTQMPQPHIPKGTMIGKQPVQISQSRVPFGMCGCGIWAQTRKGTLFSASAPTASNRAAQKSCFILRAVAWWS